MRLLGVLATVFLAACGTPGGITGATCGIRPFAEVPVRVVQNVPLVDAVMNGAPVTLILDSGADRTVLTNEAARRVGLVFDQRDIRRGAGAGGVVSSFAARVRRFELAGLSIPDHPVLATPHPLGGAQGERIDGLLPALVLSAFDVDLDMPGRKMTLYGGTVCGDTAIPAWAEPAVTIPADFTPGPRVMLRVRTGSTGGAGGTELRALLDTGAQTTVATPLAAGAAGLTAADIAAGRPITVRGIGPLPVAARVVRLPELEIGPERGRGVPVVVTDSGLDKFDMILGMDYLGSRRLWLSYARRQVFIMVRPRQ